MNFRQLTLAVATALAFPIASHAQETASPVTRAQVRAELVQIEKAGYLPGVRTIPTTRTTFRLPRPRSAHSATPMPTSKAVRWRTGRLRVASGSRTVAKGLSSLFAHH